MISFCPICKSRSNIGVLFRYCPLDIKLASDLDYMILFFPVCSKCLEKYDFTEIEEYIHKHARELYSNANKVYV